MLSSTECFFCLIHQREFEPFSVQSHLPMSEVNDMPAHAVQQLTCRSLVERDVKQRRSEDNKMINVSTTDFHNSPIPQHGSMSLWNLATLSGILVNGGKLCTEARTAPFSFCFCCTILCYFTRAFLWRHLATGNSLDPRYLLLCMTMNKSEHEMLIRGTLSTVQEGEKKKRSIGPRFYKQSHL